MVEKIRMKNKRSGVYLNPKSTKSITQKILNSDVLILEFGGKSQERLGATVPQWNSLGQV